MKKTNNFMITASVMTALIIVLIVVFNIFVGALGDKVNLKFDLSDNQVLSFSDETKAVLDNLEEDVNIYSLIPEDSKTKYHVHIRGIIEKYETMSNHIKYNVVNGEKNPELISKFKENGNIITNDCVIFETDKRYKVVDTAEAIASTQDTSYLNAEKLFTSAIMTVSGENSVDIGVITGHGEPYTAVEYNYILSSEGYNIKDIDLLKEDIPDTTNMLIITAPKKDFDAKEIDKIDKFLDKGNSIQVLMSPEVKDVPNLTSYLGEWGVEMVSKFIADTDSDSYYNNPYYIFPQIVEGNDVTSDILMNNLKMIYPYSSGIKANSNPYIVEKVLLTTSDKAIEVSDESEQLDAQYNKYNLAVILEKPLDNDKSAKMFVSGTYEFINPTLKQVTTANEDYYNNIIQYFAGNESNIYIRAKNITPPFITLSQFQGYFYGAIIIIIIPLAIIIYGLIVWMRRRHL